MSRHALHRIQISKIQKKKAYKISWVKVKIKIKYPTMVK